MCQLSGSDSLEDRLEIPLFHQALGDSQCSILDGGDLAGNTFTRPLTSQNSCRFQDVQRVSSLDAGRSRQGRFEKSSNKTCTAAAACKRSRATSAANERQPE